MALTIIIFSFVAFFVGLSAVTKYYPPKKPNNVYGFRSKKSLSSPENWVKANEIFGDLFFRYSIINAIIVTIFFIIFDNNLFVLFYTFFSYLLVFAIVMIKTSRRI